MKYIFLNLKRFDVPVELGGVNRLAPVNEWAKTIVEGTQEGLKKYDPAKVEFVQFFPEAHILNAVAALCEASPVKVGCQSLYRVPSPPTGPPPSPKPWAAAGCSSATARSATTRPACWPRPAWWTPPR